MNKKSNKYRIGDAWVGRTREGRNVTIWFAGISPYGYEIWRWSATYNDGSGIEFDWCTSLSSCKRDAPCIVGRYKRIKKETK